MLEKIIFIVGSVLFEGNFEYSNHHFDTDTGLTFTFKEMSECLEHLENSFQDDYLDENFHRFYRKDKRVLSYTNLSDGGTQAHFNCVSIALPKTENN